MVDKLAHDYSGDDGDENFLSKDEIDFLNASTSHNEINDDDDVFLEFASFTRHIQSGVTLSKKFRQRIKQLMKKKSSLNKLENELAENEIKELSEKLILSNKSTNHLIMAMYHFCEDNLLFWHNCSVDIYQNFYGGFMQTYLEKYPNSTLTDFLKNEYNHFYSEKINNYNPLHNASESDIEDLLQLSQYETILNNENTEFFKIIKQRKLDFITSKIHENGYTVEIIQSNKSYKLNLIPIINNEIEDDDEITLNLSQLPSYNLEERYEILVKLGFENTLLTLNTSKKSKNMLLGLIMGVSVDNAKKLLDGTYKLYSDKEKTKIKKAETNSKIEALFERHEIKLNK